MDEARCRNYSCHSAVKGQMQILCFDIWLLVPLLYNSSEKMCTYLFGPSCGCWWRSEEREGDIARDPQGT